ncbi:SMP-30/gluconolactonase/LRE family protein [Salinisphaera sp. SPP-AMP-43]|uniref:SMP-30/gluconolactonase/LRE family protein n=1 Tax=Salinisphaera sp. SPP-AMP-43 TaxID=3121288 RepID=UPI003C6E76C5
MSETLTPHLRLSMTLGEGLHWDPENQALYWVDIIGGQLHRLAPDSGHHTTVDQGEAITCVVRRTDGGLLAAMRSGIWLLDDTGHKQQQLVEAPEDTHDHRFNDGGTDPAGRFWIGTMNEAQSAADASLYCYDGQTLSPRLSDMTITNGLAFSPDGRWMYHTDTPTRIIRRHPFDADTGKLGAGETWVDLNRLDIEGYPDGAAVDAEGYYWTALFGGAAVARFDPAGTLVSHHPMSALQPTMPAFGGTDGRTLFVTTAREGMDEDTIAQWPDSGSLFSMQVDTPGRPAPAFKAAPANA